MGGKPARSRKNTHLRGQGSSSLKSAYCSTIRGTVYWDLAVNKHISGSILASEELFGMYFIIGACSGLAVLSRGGRKK